MQTLTITNYNNKQKQWGKPMNRVRICPQTTAIVQEALLGLKINEIAHKLKIPYTTVADIVRRYTKSVRILIRELPETLDV